MTQVLSVYVARHCFGTAEATRLAAEVRQRLPQIQVKVMMLGETSMVDVLPVSATPSYFLDDRLLFLGNPRLEELMAKIALLSPNKGGIHE